MEIVNSPLKHNSNSVIPTFSLTNIGVHPILYLLKQRSKMLKSLVIAF